MKNGKAWLFSLSVALALVGCAVLSTGCNVTRVVTTQSSYVQHGDTTTQIMTKTIETYDATKK